LNGLVSHGAQWDGGGCRARALGSVGGRGAWRRARQGARRGRRGARGWGVVGPIETPMSRAATSPTVEQLIDAKDDRGLAELLQAHPELVDQEFEWSGVRVSLPRRPIPGLGAPPLPARPMARDAARIPARAGPCVRLWAPACAAWWMVVLGSGGLGSAWRGVWAGRWLGVGWRWPRPTPLPPLPRPPPPRPPRSCRALRCGMPAITTQCHACVCCWRRARR